MNALIAMYANQNALMKQFIRAKKSTKLTLIYAPNALGILINRSA